MEWLQEHMRKHLGEAQRETPETPKGNVLSLRPQAVPAKNVGAAALELVERTIELFKDAKNEAAAKERLARDAIEKLRSAEEWVRGAEAARRAAEARVDEVSAKLRDVEMALERRTANSAAAQTKIFAAEERARDAEERASEAENALKRIETMIRTLISEKRGEISGAE